AQAWMPAKPAISTGGQRRARRGDGVVAALRGCAGGRLGAEAVGAEAIALDDVLLAHDLRPVEEAAEEVELARAGFRGALRDAVDGAVVLLEEVIALRGDLPLGEVALLIEEPGEGGQAL